MALWDKINQLFGRSKLQELLTQNMTNAPIYPDTNKNAFYLDSYTGNGDVFSIINKITEPGARVPISHVRIGDDEPIQNSRVMALLEKPNPFMSQTEFMEACLSFFNIFGNCFIANESADFGLRVGQPTRLDVIPPQWMEIVVGDMFTPIKGYTLTEASGQDLSYEFGKVMHWKEFNPDFNISGKHLYGMSRLRPLIKQVIASQSGYDSMVSAFQNMGAYGILTVLGVKEEDGRYGDKPETRVQLEKMMSEWRKKWTGNSKRGEVAVTNKSTEWTPFGMSVQDMSILASLPISRGVIADAYNVPEVLLANSSGRTYANYQEAMKALWNNAIIPNVDGLLNKLSDWLCPAMGYEGTMLVANYDDIPALQADKKEQVEWMIKAGLTFNEIREALGYEELGIPNMDIPIISMGMQRVDEISMMPEPEITEEVLKRLKVDDYRKA